MKRLSIIIVTYNSEHDIYDCVSSIMKFSDIPLSEIELIIVDNNSRDTDTMFIKLKELYGNDIVLIKIPITVAMVKAIMLVSRRLQHL